MRALRMGGILSPILALLLLSAQFCACVAAFGYTSSAVPYNAIGSIKSLPDGAYVYLNQKVITSLQGTYFYVEESDRSAGIKVSLGAAYLPTNLNIGNLATVSGQMSTQNGERFIAKGDVLEFNTGVIAKINPLGMSTPSLMGWPADVREPYGARVTGLMPTGLYVKIWGKPTITSRDAVGSLFTYLDDGWDKYDGTNANASGVRVYSNIEPDTTDEIWCALGVVSSKSYDPTPNTPGDDVIFQCILTNSDDDFLQPDTSSSPQTFGTISGRVRLVGQGVPGKTVVVYSERGNILLDNVTDAWKSFTLTSVPAGGTAITASSSGYVSKTRVANIGSTDVDFALEQSQSYVNISSDKTSIAICDTDIAHITAIFRDCEGKGIEGQQLRITTTAGIFTESGTNELIGTSGLDGKVTAHLSSGNEEPGTATVKVETYPSLSMSSETQIDFVAPEISVSASPKILETSGTSLVSAALSSLGTAMPDEVLTFTTNYGTFAENGLSSYTVLTDENGNASANLQISGTGSAIVVVSYLNDCSYETVAWTSVGRLASPWYSSSVINSHPLVVDLDGGSDGNKEIVVATNDGHLVALSVSGSLLWASEYLGGHNTASCAPMNAERSGRPCIFLPAESEKAYAFSYDGKRLAGWPTSTSYLFYGMACSIGDINRDGTPEIVSGDQCCYVWSWNPSGAWSSDSTVSPLWINLTGTSKIAIRNSTCALGDIDNDANGILDVVVGTFSDPGNIYAFPGDLWGNYSATGHYLTNWPKSGGGSIETAPAMGDIDGDGKNDVAWAAVDGNLHIWLSSTDSQVLREIGSEDTSTAIYSSPALADLDGDGKLDIIIGSCTGLVHAFNWLGDDLPGWENGIKISTTEDDSVDAPVVVGDVTGDGQINVVAVCSDGLAYAIYADGINHKINGKRTGPLAWVGCCRSSNTDPIELLNAPVIDDLDNDGLVEIVVAGSQGVYIFQTEATYTGSSSLYPWPTFHHDNRRSGCVTPPPAPINASIQGIISHAGSPISGASIKIYKNDGSIVYQPNTTTERISVLSVGSSLVNEVGKGAYCISQLDHNQTYKLVISASGYVTKTVSGIAVGTGLTRVDVSLSAE